MRYLSASFPSSTSQSERRTIDRPAPPAPAYTPYEFNGPTTFSTLKRQETLVEIGNIEETGNVEEIGSYKITAKELQ